jgi:DNA repair protein RadD
MFTLRPYQAACNAAIHNHICTREGNPCAVLPTGAGKSVTMAALIHDWYQEAPWVRGCILAHRKELVQQNHDKLVAYLGRDVGIYSAGLGRRDHDAQMTYASIDSIYKKAGEFPAFDFLFVDEAHRIPPSGQGKYRQFIQECQKMNQNLRIVGWTATPFRMGCGPICHKDYILNHVCYEAEITDLIKQGYLSNLRTKVSGIKPDLSGVRRNSGGDYIVNSLADAVNKGDLVSATVGRAISYIQEAHRKAAIFFCVDVEHCKRVSEELAKYGIEAPAVTGKTKKRDRDRIIENFKAKRIKVVCCVNVLTEGFDAPHIDTIVLLRPTLSPGLFSQMVGRGLRISPDKDFCLVLDFAGCIEEHGPLDLLGSGDTVPMYTCAKCDESFPRPLKTCPACGWEIPPREIERLEQQDEAERRMHEAEASKKAILSGEPQTYEVHSVSVGPHLKPGSPNSIKVRYRCGLNWYNEWVCLDHPNYARHKACEWWRVRFGNDIPTVSDALNDMFLAQRLAEWTRTITVKREGRHMRVIGYNQDLKD